MSVWLALLSAVIVACLLHYRKSLRSRLPLPPGPRRLPFVGNVFDMPKQYAGADFRALTDKYGDMVYLDVLGKPMLVLGTHDIAHDLLEKRSAIYSDRVQSTMIDLGGFDWVLTMIPYGPWWRRNRRAFHQFFNPNAVVELRSMQRAQVNHFLHRLLSAPDEFSEHIRQYVSIFSVRYIWNIPTNSSASMFAATVMRVAYGIKISESNDEYVKMAEDGLAAFSNLLVPGKYLAEQFLVLRFLPKWIPGAQFLRDAANAKMAAHRVRDVPWSRTLEEMVRSFVLPTCLSC
ncbi:O-methylsterigmatocystin oxidoreductase [Trametes pubescens]|uniref:O-methylsterigmatocystin oxidoreductase n=1 Tax=Trametes pubescens TaxID=154538 RepID=A0A1M2V5A6_TRAPU|nr:O-methylsterigmatocystin oxidoreductase [Trametes pubescens]